MNSRYADTNTEFDQKFKSGQKKAANAAEQGFGTLAKSLQDVIGLQTAEIERLRQLIESGAVPERHAEEIALTSHLSGGLPKCDIVVKANDGSLWLLPNAPRSPYALPHREGWVRLPALPQAADEMKSPRSENDGEEN